MEHGGSLPSSQQTATCPPSPPPKAQIIFYMPSLSILLRSTLINARIFQVVALCRFSHQNPPLSHSCYVPRSSVAPVSCLCTPAVLTATDRRLLSPCRWIRRDYFESGYKTSATLLVSSFYVSCYSPLIRNEHCS